MDKLRVDLKESVEDRSYDIIIDNGVLDNAGSYIKELGYNGKCVVVTNPTVGGLYYERLKKTLNHNGLEPLLIEVGDGEEYKSLSVAGDIFDFLVSNRVERTTPIIALGGGVVGDMAGFVAASYLRGVPYIQIPTTLLSQVDSSVGGKTAVNHPGGKNLIGAFYQPKIVIIDPLVLQTLDEGQFKSGLGEVIKYGIIYDKDFFEYLISNSDDIYNFGKSLIEVIKRSCLIKAEIVSFDERESGIRAILNLGHTFGHAIEALTNYKGVAHGEAVAIGMGLAADFAVYLRLATCDCADTIKDGIKGLKLMTTPPEGLKISAMIDVMSVDKKVKDGSIYFILPTELGSVITRKVEITEIEHFLQKTSLFC